MGPTLESHLDKRKEIFKSQEFSDPIEENEFLLKLFLDPYNVWEPIVKGKEPVEPSWSIKEARKKFIDIFSLFLSDKYPIVTNYKDIYQMYKDLYHSERHIIDLYQQLVTIGVFYKSIHAFKTVPVNILLRIDSIMTQLAFEVAEWSHAIKKGATKDFRIRRGKGKKSKIKADRKQPVLEEFHRIGDITGMSKRKIARKIHENLNKQQRDVPVLKTIQRYLEEENLI
jgi:hypothetical protein